MQNANYLDGIKGGAVKMELALHPGYGLVVAVVPLLDDLDNGVARLDKGDLYITARSGSCTPRGTPRTRGYEAARWRH